MIKDQYFVVIPAYEPSDVLVEIVDQLTNQMAGLSVIVVNDGSVSPKAQVIFSLLAGIPNVEILTHEENRGKGAALKTGFRAIIDRGVTDGCVVTADADGQHVVSDILNVLTEADLTSMPVLGARRFGKQTPFRSFFGNKVTSFLFRLFLGGNITDTQTGLRAFSVKHLPQLVKIVGEDYDYEMRQLTEFWRKTEFREIFIETVYQPNNPTSHFNPLLDSMKIYWVLCRHVLVSSFIGAIDFFILFSIIAYGASVEVAVFISRAISCVFYFSAMRRSVFKVRSSSIIMALKFTLNIGLNLWLFPIVFDNLKGFIPNTLFTLFSTYMIFYIFNFLFQRHLVFTEKKVNAG